jgi:tetrahydromethanopterin S-methyltransferase subunit D
LRDTIGLDQRRSQEWAEKVDSLVDLAVMKGVKFLVGGGIQAMRTGAGVGVGAGMVAAGAGIGAVEHERIIRSTYHLPNEMAKKVSGNVITKAKIIYNILSM